MNIKIAQLNQQHSKLALHEIRRIAEERQLDIICLQEPYTRNGKIPFMPITAQIVTQGPNPMSGVIILNREIKVTKISQVSDEWTVCVEILTHIGKFISQFIFSV